MGSMPYILQLRERLQKLGELAQQNLRQAQHSQERQYNPLLLTSSESKLLAKWQGHLRLCDMWDP